LERKDLMKRRNFIKTIGLAGVGLFVPWKANLRAAYAKHLDKNTLDPREIPKYVTPLVKPPAMPGIFGIESDYYEIAVRQFQQHILPESLGLQPTTVWSYGSASHPGTALEGGTFNYPAFTIEAKFNKRTEVKWINDLKDTSGNFLPHILAVDQTLHWANPPGGLHHRDHRGMDPAPYLGPVPTVTHVHGAHTNEESDGYAEAWFLPDANNIPASYAKTGTFFDYFNNKYALGWGPGFALFKYPNDQRATTLWYHDHTLGMTRLNVYAGPAGFYLLRGGPDDQVSGTLPGPAPGVGDDPFGTYYEIPIVIQDRSFKTDGSLFYPDNRAFFEGLDVEQLQIPFIPEQAVGGPSDVSPIWNPEFFGNTMVVNGKSWPYLEVEQRRYRFRLLNGCNSRFLILKFDNGLSFYQIGSEGGFLSAPIQLDQLLMAPAERADVIVDFTNVATGTEIILLNLGPDEPFGGGTPGVDFESADSETTGQIMQFRVIPAASVDASTPPMDLILPTLTELDPAVNIRDVSLNEEESRTVFIKEEGENIIFDPNSTIPFGPTEALLGTLNPDGTGIPLGWMDQITENPGVGDIEEWIIHNFTMDAHPIHIHQVMFKVLGRGEDGNQPPEAWETGWKDTVIAYPDEKTRVKAKYDLPGFYVWHCHIVEHEDNEMMRPYHVGPIPQIGIASTVEKSLPKEYVLNQNYPNPFNASTKITFRISQPEAVEIKIFDIKGREVCSLLNSLLNAGKHSVIWDGKNNFGAIVASGIYIYQLRAGSYRRSRRMNLIR
jgi:spore coat protein A